MTRPILFTNARIVDPETLSDAPGALLVADGKIADHGPSLSAPDGAERIDCGGRVLSPGLVDLRVFTGEPGAEHRETIASAGVAAAAGGVTTMLIMPATDPAIDDPALVQYVKRAACAVRALPAAALTRGRHGEAMAELGLLADAGAVAFTDADRTVANTRVMRRAMSYAANFDLLVIAHCQDPFLSDGAAMSEGEFATRLGLPGETPMAEALIVARDLTLAGMTGCRLHIGQVSTRAALALISSARATGHGASCAVSAPHFALNERDIGTYLTFRKLTPPLRSEDDRSAMLEGLASGAIDAAVSSHDPQAPDTKRLPFAQAAAGGVGLETLLPVTLSLVHQGGVSLAAALQRVTSAPARILRLDDGTGTLRRGARADLCVFDPDGAVRIKRGALRSRSKNTPFEGMSFQGKVWRSYCAGRLAFAGDDHVA